MIYNIMLFFTSLFRTASNINAKYSRYLKPRFNEITSDTKLVVCE
ncbi:MAG: hypothetical protein JWQ54_4548 [Mucilaginibacter sp.]|nr:hypothetical protein [Mucilaginibacter sp.]